MNMDGVDISLLCFGVLVVGLLIGTIITDISHNIVTKEAKHEVCKELYGQEYYFIDNEVGVDGSFNCQRDIITIESEIAKESLVKKLN